MYKAIVTLQNPDGSYDEVGMNNRTIIGPYKRLYFVYKQANEFAKHRNHKKFRIEIFTQETMYQERPWITTYRAVK